MGAGAGVQMRMNPVASAPPSSSSGAYAGAGAGAGGPHPHLQPIHSSSPRSIPATPALQRPMSVRRSTALAPFASLAGVAAKVGNACRQHNSGPRLRVAIEEAGKRLDTYVRAEHVASISTSYDNLLRRMMLENERQALAPLEFQTITLTRGDGEEIKKGPGRLLVTNQRLLLLSCAPSTTGNLKAQGNPKVAGAWKVQCTQCKQKLVPCAPPEA